MKIRNNYLADLQDLCFLVKSLYPHKEVIDPYSEVLTESNFSKPVQQLVKKLVKALVILNQPHRVENHWGKLESSREDFINALHLVERQVPIAARTTLLSRPDRIFYNQLFTKFEGKEFTRKQAMQATNLSKTNTHWKLWELMVKGLVERCGGSANKGYYYRLVET